MTLTGNLSSYGIAMKQGIDVAFSELDSTKYTIIYEDSKGQSVSAVSAMRKLINVNKVNYIIGDVSSSTTLAMVPIASQNSVFLLSPGAASPDLTNISPMFARNYPSSVEESTCAAQFVYENLASTDLAVVSSNDDYGIGLARKFVNVYQQLGGSICFQESYASGTTNFRDLVIKIKESKPKVVYIAGNQKEMGHFIKQAKEIGIRTHYISNMAFLESDCLDVAGEAANDVIVPIVKYDIDYTKEKGFISHFKHKYNINPTMANAVGYDALKLIIHGIDECGNNPHAVASYIRNLKNYSSILGTLNFYDGDVVVPIEFKIVKNGKVVNYTFDN